MEKILFKEEQKFHQWWMWLILLFVFVVAVVPIWYGLFIQVTTGKPWGDDPTSNAGLAAVGTFTTLLTVGLLLLFKTARLVVEIRSDSVCFKFPPLIRKWRIIHKSEIERFAVGKYNPLTEYGGWGIRRSHRKYGRAYNVSGNLGLRLYLKNKKIVLLGTRRTQAVAYAMEKMMSDQLHSF